MIVISKNPTFAGSLTRSILAALGSRPAGALMPTPFVHLFTAIDAPIGPNLSTADFTEASFSGYAAVSLAVGASVPISLPFGSGLGWLNTGTFVADAGIVTPGQSILGYYVTRTSSGSLYFCEQFATPVPIVDPFDWLALSCIVPFPYSALASM